LRQSTLELVRQTVPAQPTWFDTVAGQENRLTFADLAELARHAVRLAGDRGLRIATSRAMTAACGFDLFPAWSLYALDPHGGEEWLGQAAIQQAPRERLEAAILAAHGRRHAA
jgi:hypothetical protein